MSANDYRCAQMDCDARAVAVYIMEGTGAIYGECADHLRPLLERARWIHAPVHRLAFTDCREVDERWWS